MDLQAKFAERLGWERRLRPLYPETIWDQHGGWVEQRWKLNERAVLLNLMDRERKKRGLGKVPLRDLLAIEAEAKDDLEELCRLAVELALRGRKPVEESTR